MDIPNLRQKADSGNVVAQSILGNCYPEGVEVGVDDEEAFRLLSSAAGQGASRDKANLARMHAEGLGVLKSLPEAIRLYEAAAQAGEFFARLGLARIHAQGLGVPADSGSALEWYSAAAGQADRIADCEELREARTYVANAR